MFDKVGEKFHSVEILQKVSQEMHTAIFFFETTSAILDYQVVTGDTLKMIARLRVCLEFVTELVDKRFLRQEKFDDDVIEHQNDLFARLVAFLKTDYVQNSEAHLFILRNVIFKYGFEELKTVVQRSGLDLAMDFDEIEEVKRIIYNVYYLLFEVSNWCK